MLSFRELVVLVDQNHLMLLDLGVQVVHLNVINCLRIQAPHVDELVIDASPHVIVNLNELGLDLPEVVDRQRQQLSVLLRSHRELILQVLLEQVPEQECLV